MPLIKNFKVDARTIIHLGRESIKDHATALLELVKNSYDADASVVEIEIYKKETLDKIRIADDGLGMTESDIDDHWLRIGFSEKRNVKFSPKGRRKTGEKGIGRLSTDRLGEDLQIVSIANQGNRTDINGIRICWELFNQDNQDLSGVPIEVIETPLAALPLAKKTDTGTELIISKLRHNWTKENIEALRNELSILTPPFSDTKDFEIFLQNDVSPEFNGKISPPDFVLPEIELIMVFNSSSSDIKYDIKDKFNGDKLKSGTIKWAELSHKVIDPFDLPFASENLSCGSVIIKLLLYPRTKALAEGTNFSLSELREYVDKNVGVKIYRDNISVKPYGYVGSIIGNDWLGLAERHSRNPAGIDRPEYRVVANQLVGAVFIGRDDNPNILDSAAREGLVENDAFFDLRAITLSAIALLENHRYSIYQVQKKRGANTNPSHSETAVIFKAEVKSAKEDVDKLKQLIKAPMHLFTENELKKTVDDIAQFVEASEKASFSFTDLLNHNRVLAGLATIGIASAVFGHETQGAITEFRESAIIAREYLSIEPIELNIIIDELEKSIKYGEQVAAWGKFALSRVQREKRKKEKRNIKEIIEGILNELTEVFKPVDIEIKNDNLISLEAQVYPMDIESILVNLLTNAYTACLQKNHHRVIKVELFTGEQNGVKGYYITIANSGHPIESSFKDWIWEPLNTLKKDSTGRETGTGLGLTIIKSIVEDLNGTKEILIDEELGGAKFKIWLPLT